jgi:hypothetical protein
MRNERDFNLGRWQSLDQYRHSTAASLSSEPIPATTILRTCGTLDTMAKRLDQGGFEMCRLFYALAIGCLELSVLASPAGAAEDLKLTGSVLKLSEIAERPFTINTGGLVVVIVRDSGSRPPKDIKVDAPRAFQPLGVVRGTQDEKGQALMGGGYNWYLFTPVNAGESAIKVNYTENGEGGKEVQRVYKVKVEKSSQVLR